MKIFIIFILSFNTIFCDNRSHCPKSTTVSFDRHKIFLNQDNDSLLLAQIRKRRIDTFINKKVDDFFQDNLLGKYQGKFTFVAYKPGRLTSLLFKYSDQVLIEVFLPNDFKYSKAFSITSKWNIELIKKEKIRRIRLIYKDKPIEEYF